MHVAEQYAEDVLSGKRPAGKLIKLACERYFRDLDQAKDKGWYFDEKEAKRAVDFVGLFKNYKGKAAGKKLNILPHQAFQHWNIYGWKNDDGSNRFTVSYEEVSRKNGKSSLSAIRALYRVIVTEPHGAHVWCCATKESQATIIPNDAANFMLQDAFWRSKIETGTKKGMMSRVVTLDPPYSFIAPIGRDSKTEDGKHASEIKIDEYHAWDSNYLLDVMQQSTKGRRNPLTDITTTAGLPFVAGKDGVCFAFRTVCVDILNGDKVDDSLFIMIHCMDDPERWKEPDQWRMPNPALDAPGCVSTKDLEIAFTKAINEGQGKIVEFKTKDLNIWTDAPKVWIMDETWMKSAARPAVWDMFNVGQQVLI